MSRLLSRLVPWLGAGSSVLCLVVFGLTLDTYADQWSALPFAAMAWAGILTASAGLVFSRGLARGAAGVCALIWVGWWLVTWSESAADLLGWALRVGMSFLFF